MSVKKRIVIVGISLLLVTVCALAIPIDMARAGYVRWVEYASFPVFNPGSAWFPCVLYDAMQFSSHGDAAYYKMWYADLTDTTWGKVAFSDDGMNWGAGVDLTGITANGCQAKVVYISDGYGAGPYYYKIWYWIGTQNYSISDLHTADSVDGINWVYDQGITQDTTYPLISGPSGTDWKRGTYGPVSVFHNPSPSNTGNDPFDYSFTMYYDATTGGEEVTALAYSADGAFWTRYHEPPYGNLPVLPHGGPTDWDSAFASFGTVVKEATGVWHFWYNGGQAGVFDGIGHASSNDGINWTKDTNNPLLDKGDGLAWRSGATGPASVLYSPTSFDGHGGDNRYKMWYMGWESSPFASTVGYAERSKIITVGPSGRDFTTIQAAIDGAYAGDTILVDPGTYYEQLFVGKDVTISSVAGSASTIIDGNNGSGFPYVVRLSTSGIVFDGFTVTYPDYAGASDASGIIVTESAAISNVRIANCVVHDIGISTRSPVVYGTVGINLGQCSNVEVDNCEIYNISHGHTGNTWAHGISIWGNGPGKYATNINIHDCYIHDVFSPNSRDAGICMQSDMNGVTVQDNVIEDTSEYGVDTWDDWGSSYAPIDISGNTISGASIAGVRMVFPGTNTVTANTLIQCDTGILVPPAGEVDSLRFNTFDGNTTYAIDNQSSNTLDAVWCYWDNPHGPSYGGITYGEAFSGDLDWRPYLSVPYGGSPPATPIQITTASPLPAGAQGSSYSIDMQASGGAAPYTWFVYAETLPPGLSLSAGGVLSGTPTATGDFTFTIEAADGQQGDFKPFTLHIGASPAALSLTKTSLPVGTVTRGQVITYTLRLRNDGGTAADEAELSDAVPAFTSYVTHTTTLNGVRVTDVGGNSPLAAGMAVNSPGEAAGVIAPGEEAVVTFMVQVGNDLPLGAKVRNTAVGEAKGLAPVEASCSNDSPPQLPSTWYFAEGSTQVGFDEYILLSNMGDSDMTVNITYLTDSGVEKTTTHLLPAHSRQTVYVNAEMPGETGVAAIVQGEDGLICERSMYYLHNGIAGGDDVIGANSPSIDLFFAEGYTGSGDNYFEEWILLLNTNSVPSGLTIDYLLASGETVRKEYVVPGRQRFTISVDAELGEGQEVSARIRSELPIVAERAMYFIYEGVWPGGHNGMAVTGARSDWYLAEGFTGYESSQFDEWILVANENSLPAAVTVTYMFPDGSTRDVAHTAPARGRLTISADSDVGEGQEVSAHIHADRPVVVERAMYFDYLEKWEGGHNCLGSSLPTDRLYFAEGYTGNPGSQFETWLLVQNTSSDTKTAVIDYILSSGDIITQDLELPPSSRSTVYVNDVLQQESLEFSIRITCKDGSPVLLAERAMYFSYTGSMGVAQGGHDVAGY